MTAKVVQFNNIGAVTFSKNRRSKNIKIRVKPDQSVHVSFPFYASAKEISEFVMKNAEWIAKQKNKFEAKKTEINENSELQTKLYTVVFFSGIKNKTTIKGNRIEIAVVDLNSDESRNYMENVVTDIYRFEAKKILPDRVAELADKFGYTYNKITIRNNKRNWGSCSSKNNISLNLQMMKLPNKLIDYILLHELVHTKVKNHGPKFWEELNSISENQARDLAKQIRKYSTYTL